MLLKYRPEDRAAKKERLLKRAQAEAEGKSVEVKKPIVVKYGLNHVTYLIEQVQVTSLQFISTVAAAHLNYSCVLLAHPYKLGLFSNLMVIQIVYAVGL